MKPFRKICISLFFVLTLIFLSLYFFVRINGRPMLLRALSAALKYPVEIKGVEFDFPLGIRLDDLKVGQFFTAQQVRLQFGFPLKWKGGCTVSHLTVIAPNVSLQKRGDKQFYLLSLLKEKTLESAAEKAENQDPAAGPGEGGALRNIGVPVSSFFSNELAVKIDLLVVENGKFQFNDSSANSKFKFFLEDITAKVRNFSYPPAPLRVQYFLAASIGEETPVFKKSRVQEKGWLNLYDRSMGGDIQIIEQNGQTGLAADLEAHDNDLTVSGKINLKNMSFLSEEKEEQEEKDFSFEDMLLGAVQSSDIDVNLDFKIKTKLDDFEFNKISFSGKLGYGGPKTAAPASAPPPEENKAQ